MIGLLEDDSLVTSWPVASIWSAPLRV